MFREIQVLNTAVPTQNKKDSVPASSKDSSQKNAFIFTVGLYSSLFLQPDPVPQRNRT